MLPRLICHFSRIAQLELRQFDPALGGARERRRGSRLFRTEKDPENEVARAGAALTVGSASASFPQRSHLLQRSAETGKCHTCRKEASKCKNSYTLLYCGGSAQVFSLPLISCRCTSCNAVDRIQCWSHWRRGSSRSLICRPMVVPESVWDSCSSFCWCQESLFCFSAYL